MEIWKDLEGDFGNQYQISNYGNVRNKITNKLLKYNLDERGYPRIRLSYNNIKSSYRIHRLVAIAFIDNPESKIQVNHIDGDKLNNHFSNLEWSTNSENQKHAVLTGLKVTKKGFESSRFKGSVLVYNLEGELIDELFGNLDMKNKGYDYRNVNAVVTGKRKTYKNLIFKRNEF